jgi:hypothetical protein
MLISKLITQKIQKMSLTPNKKEIVENLENISFYQQISLWVILRTKVTNSSNQFFPFTMISLTQSQLPKRNSKWIHILSLQPLSLNFILANFFRKNICSRMGAFKIRCFRRTWNTRRSKFSSWCCRWGLQCKFYK